MRYEGWLLFSTLQMNTCTCLGLQWRVQTMADNY